MIGYEPTVAQSFLGGLFEIVRSNGEKLNEMQVRFLLRGEERLKLTPGTLRFGFGVAMPHPSMTLLWIAFRWRKLMMRWVWPGTALMRTSRKPIVPKRLIFTRIN